MISTLLFIVVLVLFTLCSGYFSLALIAIFSLSTTEAKLYAKDQDKRKRLVVSLLAKPRDLLVTLLFYDIAANILIQNTAANLFGDHATWLFKVGVPLVLTLILGEILPKTLALPFNTHIAYLVAPSIHFLHRLLGPIRSVITAITSQLSRLVFFFLKKEKQISKEELKVLLHSSEGYGILNREEAKLTEGYLNLTTITVKERMRPRHEILYYDMFDPLEELIFLFAEKECSKVPVCQGDIQNILGILSAKNFFLNRARIAMNQDLIPLLQKPYYVPETINARTLMRHFFLKQEEMAIVLDEYSSVSGLITQEDLFEIVVGEISDRRDEKPLYTPAGRDVIIASGKFELSSFEELFHVALPSESNVVTIGGWLMEQMGTIPTSGTKYSWNNFLFHVLAAEPNRIRRVYIRKLGHE